MNQLLPESEVFHYWQWLTEAQQGAYTEASIAWRKAQALTTDQIITALEDRA